MATKRKIEVFTAGCGACDDAVSLVRRVACASCEIEVLDMHDPAIAGRAKAYGIHSVPAIVIDGQLAACCTERGPDEAALRAADIGTPLP